MADTERKLVGSLYLDISELEQKVARANELLGSIGAGVNLDVTSTVEKQVRGMLESLKNETQRAATQMNQNLAKLGDGFKASSTHVEHLLASTQRLYRDGSVVHTQKGFDDLNRSIQAVYHNGE